MGDVSFIGPSLASRTECQASGMADGATLLAMAFKHPVPIELQSYLRWDWGGFRGSRYLLRRYLEL